MQAGNEYFRECLHTFNYPNIQIMSVEKIDELFDIDARVDTLTWMFEVIDSNYFTEDREFINIYNLADLVCEYGFCREDQKRPFADGTLNLAESHAIFSKMFTFMCNMNRLRANKEYKDDKISWDTLNTLGEKGIKVFYKHDYKFLLTPEDQQKLIQELNEKLQQAESASRELNNFEVSKSVTKMSEISDIIMKLKNTLPQLVNLCNSVTTLLPQARADWKLKEPDAEDVIKKLNLNIHAILEYLKNLKVIRYFNNIDIQADTISSENIEQFLDIINKDSIVISELPFVLEKIGISNK